MMDLSEESSYELLLCDHPITVPVHLCEQLVRKLGKHCWNIVLEIQWQEYNRQNPIDILSTTDTFGYAGQKNYKYIGY